MSLLISTRDHRTVVLGGFAIVTILGAGRLVPWWTEWVADERASAAELEREWIAARTAVRTLPVTRDSARARVVRADSIRATALRTATPALAGAELAEHVSHIAATAGVRLGALTIDAGASGQGSCPITPRGACLQRVRVRTELAGDLRSIAFFLAVVERGSMPATIPQLTLTQSGADMDESHVEALRGTVTIQALALDSTPVPSPRLPHRPPP